MLALALAPVLAACGARSGEAPPPVKRDAGVVAPHTAPSREPPPFEVTPPVDKVHAVGRDDRHTCVVRASGAVDCWGTIATCPACELGPPPDPTVRRVPGLTDAVDVSADGRCFVRRTGEAACFTGTGLDLTPVAGIARAVLADGRGGCFVDVAGGVICDGFDRKAWKVPGLADVIGLASNDLATCAVRRSGTLSCGTQSEDDPWRPVRGIDKVSTLAMAGRMDSYACVMREGALRCFELSPYGDGAAIVVDPESKEHPLATHVAQRFAGATQLVMRVEDNRLYLEGIVGGRVVVTDFEEVWEVPLLTDALGLARQCAIRAQGSLVCWGSNAGGALAQPTTIMNADVPATTVAGLTGVVDIATGLSRSYALTRDGRVWWWGRIWDGLSLVSAATPVELKLGLGPANLVEITADRGNHVCMRGASGDVWCQVEYLESRIEQLDTTGARRIEAHDPGVVVYRTGAPAELHAILEREDLVDATLEITPLLDPTAEQFAWMGDVACVRRTDGTVGCGDTKSLTAATQLATSWGLGCAAQRGRAWCWIESGTDGRYALSEIVGLRDVVDVAASRDGACAVHGGGRVSCWRFDEQPGADAPVRTWRAPVEVVKGGAVEVELGRGARAQYRRSFDLHGPAAAGAYGCARMVDGTVQCWGMNIFGELGDGSLVTTRAPIGVAL